MDEKIPAASTDGRTMQSESPQDMESSSGSSDQPVADSLSPELTAAETRTEDRLSTAKTDRERATAEALKTVTNSRALSFGLLLLIVGLVLIVPPGTAHRIWSGIQANPRTSFGLLCIGIAMLTFLIILPPEYRRLVAMSFPAGNFLDVDKDFRRDSRFRASSAAATAAHAAAALQADSTVSAGEVSSARGTAPSKAEPSKPEHPFIAYFHAAQNHLIKGAEKADQKASVALDNGKAYLKYGIFFYTASIVAWQFLAGWKGFQQAYIYGIASCSLLFIFIEFLSAWFLKQYRNFTDTSMYLTKVKTLLDRHMLVFLLLQDSTVRSASGIAAASTLLEMLKTDIKWPESHLLKNPDVNFARETIESLAELAKSWRQAESSKSTGGK